MTTSISTRSGVSARALATPSAPLSAVSTSCLCFSRMVEIFLTSVGESSTIRMRAMVSSMVLGVQQVLLFRLRHVVADGVEQLILAEGLVRYWSEPTMRPLALSNRPSLLESMITGVFLKEELFLISAQVW